METAPFYWGSDIDDLQDLSPEVGVFGYLGDTWRALTKLGKIVPDPVDYPEQLKHLLGRDLRQGTLGEVRASIKPTFVKPIRHKQFTGFVWDGSPSSRNRVLCEEDESPVWISSVLDIATEYRCFVLEQEILDVRQYKGDWSKAPSRQVVESAVKDMAGGAPVAYTLDFGVLRTGETILIEMNDSYAVGHYGLAPDKYAKMLSARWVEMSTSKAK